MPDDASWKSRMRLSEMPNLSVMSGLKNAARKAVRQTADQSTSCGYRPGSRPTAPCNSSVAHWLRLLPAACAATVARR